MASLPKPNWGVPAFALSLHGAILRRSCRSNVPPIWSAQLQGSKSSAKVTTFRLAPSDFAFLWEECRRCFYFKVHKKMYRPRAPFPTIFGNIDLAMKRHFKGLRTDAVLPDMRGGTFLCEEEDAWVECEPIRPPGHQHSVFIRGMVDGIVKFDDETFGVIDFKTSSSQKTASTYARQLHAYMHAIENPSRNSELIAGKVSDMGLVVYTPKDFHTPVNADGRLSAALLGDLTYVPVERDDEEFTRFLGEILDVLTLPEAPPAPKPIRKRPGVHSSCPYCQFLWYAEQKNMIPS